MTAKQSNLTSWITLALTVGTGIGTAIYQFATLKAEVHAQGETLVEIKTRLDLALPPAPQLPLTAIRSRSVGTIQQITTANDAPSRTAFMYPGGHR